MKNWTKSYLCMIVPVYSEDPAFYRQKPRGGRRKEIMGANAPPTEMIRPRKCGFGHVFAASLWPGGHSRGW